MSVYEKYMYDNYTGLGPTGYEGRKINKDVDLILTLQNIQMSIMLRLWIRCICL